MSNNHDKKKDSISIWQMTIDDVAKVFHLGESLFTARTFPTLYRTWDEYEVLRLFQDDPEFCLVAEPEDSENGEMAGFLLGTTISKRHSAWKYGYLAWLGISPEYQGHGVGEKLFNYYMDLMIENGVRMLIVDTEGDNIPAIKFFKKMGFGNPQEHVYMTLNLDPQRKQLKEKEANEEN